MWFIICIIIVLAITGAFVAGIKFADFIPIKIETSFDIEKTKAIEHLNEIREKNQQEYKQKLEQEVGHLRFKLGEIKTAIFQNEQQLELVRQQNQARLDQLQVSLMEEVKKQSEQGALQVQGVIEYYNQQQMQVQSDFELYQEEMAAKRQELEDEYKKAEARQLEIIEEYKRAEEIKNNKDYYRIKLSESDTDDVKRLRKFADELHNPSALYKLIYKEYYERPFNEMVGRVVTGRGSCGIYKITNLENGRCYIGQTKQTFKERWRTHLKRGVKAEVGTQNKLYAAMWEDGVENYTFEVLAECEVAELNEKEKEYIALYHADSWGYNSTGGNS